MQASRIKLMEFYIQWHILERCNLRCRHCYQSSFSFSELSDGTIMNIAKTIKNTLSKWRRHGHISLTGGEPFIRKDLIFKLLEFFESSNSISKIVILTNGTLIQEDDIKQLKSFKKLKEIQVSLDGGDAGSNDAIRGKGIFDKVIETLKLLKVNNLTVSIMFTLHRKNLDQVSKIIDLSNKIGVDALKIERITPISKVPISEFWIEPLELKRIYEYIHKEKGIRSLSSLEIRTHRPLWGLIDYNINGFCPVGFGMLTLLHDGTILPCRRLPIPIGNILTDGLYKVWYTSGLLWELRNRNNLKGKCSNCEYLYKCSGCRAIAFAVLGDYMAEDPQCWKEGNN
ncbi:MAG: radical SAM protein [Candidatus Hydrogenedens sp.]|nr:radical SAM protein [Candidatus Hydrogenedens sp.]